MDADGDPALIEADLTGARLDEADLRNAHLDDFNLTDAYLYGADLSGATGVTEKQLEAQTLRLEGATVPDGSKHP